MSKSRSKVPPRLDATNLAGITSLMNDQNVRSGANLEEAEYNVMGKNNTKTTNNSTVENDPIQLYTKELNELADELGIDFLDPEDQHNTQSVQDVQNTPNNKSQEMPIEKDTKSPHNPLEGNSIDDLIGGFDLGSDSCLSETYKSDDIQSSQSEYSETADEEESNVSSVEDINTNINTNTNTDVVFNNLERDLGINSKETFRRGKNRHKVHYDSSANYNHANHSGGRLENLTEEKERRSHINSVMGDMRKETRTSFGVEYERAQDVKASKLEQIGQLRMTLEEEGVDCSGVGDPNMESPIEEIESVLAILKLKNDRNRYSSLAEEVILGFAEGIETVFDGSREVPMVGWKPDYTGYHNTVNIKLHRMRFETSQVVGNVIEKYNVGPTTRIFMELLPSFFLYPRQQHKQKGTPGLHADFNNTGQISQVSDARRAYASIHNSDRPDDINNL